MTNERRRLFIKGAITLSTAGLISRLMGFAYRIVLPRVIGAEGVGLYQLAYPIYTTLLVVSTSGLPVALAKMISDKITKKDYKFAYKIFRVCLNMSIGIGLFLSLLMAVLAGPIIDIFSWDPRSIYSILAITPAVFFVSIMSTYRGFFQGLQNMVPTAFSQVTEQFFRIVTMVILVFLLLPYGIEFAAAGATFGAVVGAITGLLVLLYIYYNKREDIWDKIDRQTTVTSFNTRKIAQDIISLAVPVTFGALILPLMSFIDAAIVPARLQIAGFDNFMELYGQLSGMALVLVHFPTIFTLSLAKSLVPAISEAAALEDFGLIKRRTESSFRLTILIALPSAVGLFVLAEPLTTVIFDSPGAAIPLRFVAWGVLFISVKQVTAAILQGLGKATIPARNLLIGAIFNAFINYFLTALPGFGIRGAALGTVSGFAIASFLNLYYTSKWTDFDVDWRRFLLKPFIAVVVMYIVISEGFAVVYNIYSYFLVDYSYTLTTFSMVFLGALIYPFVLLLLNEIKYGDLILIPKVGKYIADFLSNWGLLKK
ncbi:MAG: putative polysaccharide biosynthesis protein [Halanaerobiaceae bacterium]